MTSQCIPELNTNPDFMIEFAIKSNITLEMHFESIQKVVLSYQMVMPLETPLVSEQSVWYKSDDKNLDQMFGFVFKMVCNQLNYQTKPFLIDY